MQTIQYFSMKADSRNLLPAFLDHVENGRKSIYVDRRRRKRSQLHWDLYFTFPGKADLVHTVTEDLSSQGFYCVASGSFVPGELRECTLIVPTFNGGGAAATLPLVCKVRVIRVEMLDDGACGVGCAIEDYHFVPSSYEIFSSSSPESIS